MHRQRIPSVAPLLVSALLAAGTLGCNARGPRSPDVPELGYFSARGYDLMDVVELNLGAGTGLHAAAEVAPARVAYGWTDTSRAGLMGRGIGSWDEYRAEMFVGQGLLHWHKDPCRGNAYLFTEETIHRMNFESFPREPGDKATPVLDRNKRATFYEQWGWTTSYQDWERPWADVTAETTLIFVSVDVAVSPQELFDFLFGIFGVDAISHDDHVPMPTGAELAD
jgi:hypothetical protein